MLKHVDGNVPPLPKQDHKAGDLSAKFERLRRELVDLAFTLETARRFDAADMAIAISGRMRALLDESELASRQQCHEHTDGRAERHG
jgi:hypothetical protein